VKPRPPLTGNHKMTFDELEAVAQEVLEKSAAAGGETEMGRAHRWGKNGALVAGGLSAASHMAHGLPLGVGGAAVGAGLASGIGYGAGRLAHRVSHGPTTEGKKVKKASVEEQVEHLTKVAGRFKAFRESAKRKAHSVAAGAKKHGTTAARAVKNNPKTSGGIVAGALATGVAGSKIKKHFKKHASSVIYAAEALLLEKNASEVLSKMSADFKFLSEVAQGHAKNLKAMGGVKAAKLKQSVIPLKGMAT
jgi:hypothetical protein